MKEWLRNGYRVKEVEFDYDLHALEIVQNNKVIATMTFDSMEQMQETFNQLNAGADVDGWEDGMGNTIRI